MRQYERNGITIDQCDECRGVFLDRGELERLVSAESTFYGSTPQPLPPQQQPGFPQQQGGFPQYQQYQQYGADGLPYAPNQPVYPTRQHHGSPGSPDSPRRYGQGHDQRRNRPRSFLENLFE